MRVWVGSDQDPRRGRRACSPIFFLASNDPDSPLRNPVNLGSFLLSDAFHPVAEHLRGGFSRRHERVGPGVRPSTTSLTPNGSRSTCARAVRCLQERAAGWSAYGAEPGATGGDWCSEWNRGEKRLRQAGNHCHCVATSSDHFCMSSGGGLRFESGKRALTESPHPGLCFSAG